MQIVITGGAGFLGRRLAHTLLQRGTLIGPSGAEEPIDTIVVLDTVTPEPAITADSRLHAATGDITDRAALAQVIDDRTTSVFHFAAVVSARPAHRQNFYASSRVRAVLQWPFGRRRRSVASAGSYHPPRQVTGRQSWRWNW